MLSDHATPSAPPRVDPHHREIEDACLALIVAGLADEFSEMAKWWTLIERRLFDHMTAEEHLVIPAYQHADPENAQVLREQHAWLREQALEIGIAIQLHTVRLEQLRSFVAALRNHARNEEASMYRWAERHVPEDLRHRMCVWLGPA